MPGQTVPSHETRRGVLEAAIALGAAQGGLLFEPEPHRPTTASLTCALPVGIGGEWIGALSTDALWARWLRVNGTVLRLPESSGLWSSLPEPFRDRLVRLTVRACIPLVQESRLVGWVFVLGGDAWATSDPRIELTENDAPAWAAVLGTAQLERLAAERAALVSRSNRLSVVGQLAASVAHEVRNPLAAVRSMVQLVLSQDAPVSEHDRLLSTALAEIDRADVALTRTLAFSRTDEPAWKEVDLSPLVTDAVSFCRAYAHRRNQTITARSVTRASVHGDHNELRQVLVNVLLNACQASADGASVHVETDVTEAGLATMTVTDRGSGMPPELLARAFEAFHSTKKDGGGLGLAISRDITRQHGGDIVLHSVVGTGTTATICLPLKDPHGPHPGR